MANPQYIMTVVKTDGNIVNKLLGNKEALREELAEWNIDLSELQITRHDYDDSMPFNVKWNGRNAIIVNTIVQA